MKKILTIGDIILDQYDICDLKTVSKGTEVFDFRHTKFMLGGAANVALGLKNSMTESWLFGYVGNDEHGRLVKSLLGKINTENVHELDGYHTTLKIRIVANDNIKYRVDKESKRIINDRVAENNLLSFLDEFSAIVISDYHKGTLTRLFAKQIIKVAASKHIPIFVDSKSKNLDMYTGVDYMIITLDEYNHAVGTDYNSIYDLKNNGYKFMDKHLIKNLIVKNNIEGSVLLSKAIGKPLYASDKAHEVCAIGAGDVYIASFCLEICKGNTDEVAFRKANKDAARSVESLFTGCMSSI